MRAVCGRDAEVAALLGAWFGVRFHQPFVAIGFADDGRLVGGALFNMYTVSDVHVTVANAGRLSRGLFRALASYAFDQAGCRRVSASVRASDTKTQELAERFGFTREGIKRHGFRDDDLVIYGMLRSECRWLGVK